MKSLNRLLAVASAAFFIAGSALAQNAGTVTNHAFALGKGPGVAGYTSLLCGSAQLAVGQSAADPICRTITGDVTITAAGATAIGATKVTSAMLNADVFSTAHSWSGQQTFVAPILGTPASGTLTNATGLPVSTGVSGLATGIAAWLATPSSANLATAVTDETGSGSLVFGTSPTLTTPTLGAATATSINKVTITAPATGSTLTIPDGVTLTGPASSGTAMTLGNTETVTGVKTFGSAGAVGRFKLAGTTSGTTVVDATAAASGTITIPAATDTLVGKATTDTLTNKTFDTAGTGNSFSINGVAANANTGTGSVVRATSPALVTPALGTPASGVATNLTGLPLTTGVTGALGLTNGGTNNSLTASNGGVVYSDASKLNVLAGTVTAGQCLLSGSSASPTWGSCAGGATVTSIAGNTGAFTLGTGLTNSVNVIQLSTPVSVANGGTGNTGGAWTTYAPTITSSGGSFTSVSAAGSFLAVGKRVDFIISVTITTVGTASGWVNVPLPTGTLARSFACGGAETAITGKQLTGFAASGASALIVRFYDVTSPIAAGNVLTLSGTYEMS